MLPHQIQESPAERIGLSQNFLKIFINFYQGRLIFWLNFIKVRAVTQNWNNIGSNVVLCSFLLKKLQWFSTKNSLIAASYTFCSIKIRTLTSSKFKNQTNDILKLLSLIAITNKGSLNKTLLLSIIAVLNENNLHLK